MVFISHRGNVDSRQPHLENQPDYIYVALSKNLDVEMDVWKEQDEILLGHDKPTYKTNLLFLDNPKFWLHAKNIEALNFLLKTVKRANVFWHQEDDFTLTNKGIIWTYPNKQLTNNSICVLPELGYLGNLANCAGICSDVISKYKR